MPLIRIIDSQIPDSSSLLSKSVKFSYMLLLKDLPKKTLINIHDISFSVSRSRASIVNVVRNPSRPYQLLPYAVNAAIGLTQIEYEYNGQKLAEGLGLRHDSSI